MVYYRGFSRRMKGLVVVQTYIFVYSDKSFPQGHSNTAMVSLWRYRSTYIYVCHLMLQSAVLKYEKTLCHFSFQESIWTFLDMSLLAFQTSWSSQTSLPMVPLKIVLLADSPNFLPKLNQSCSWSRCLASHTSPISPISQSCLQNAFP